MFTGHPKVKYYNINGGMAFTCSLDEIVAGMKLGASENVLDVKLRILQDAAVGAERVKDGHSHAMIRAQIDTLSAEKRTEYALRGNKNKSTP